MGSWAFPQEELPAVRKARELVRQMIQEENIVGLAISVSVNDSLIWSEGFGYSDLAGQTPITPGETYFRIASISKPVTATLLGRLYEEGIIELDKSLYTYVPDFPKKTYDFTIRQLANHRAGIRHYTGLERENRKPLSIEEGLQKFQDSKLKFEPGTAYQYSSYGYNLLGVAMQRAAQQPFEDLLRIYVTEPLNMKHTVADSGVYDRMQTSGFFESNGKGKNKEAKPVNMYMKLPSGGMLSTSEDLVRLGNAYAFGRILQDETRNAFLANVPLPNGKNVGYGLGWGLGTDKQGRTFISHTGGNTGSVCRLIVYPEETLTIAVVSNTYGIDWLKFIRVLSAVSTTFLDERK